MVPRAPWRGSGRGLLPPCGLHALDGPQCPSCQVKEPDIPPLGPRPDSEDVGQPPVATQLSRGVTGILPGGGAGLSPTLGPGSLLPTPLDWSPCQDAGLKATSIKGLAEATQLTPAFALQLWPAGRGRRAGASWPTWVRAWARPWLSVALDHFPSECSSPLSQRSDCWASQCWWGLGL